MLYMCQFGKILTVGSEDRVIQGLSIELNDPCDLEYQFKVTKI